MDRSTAEEVRELDGRFGKLFQLDTGSPSIERFAGPQTRRFAKLRPEDWRLTARVDLASYFACSLLCVAPAPIDFGDGAGMNLLNLKTLAFTAPGLETIPPV